MLYLVDAGSRVMTSYPYLKCTNIRTLAYISKHRQILLTIGHGMVIAAQLGHRSYKIAKRDVVVSIIAVDQNETLVKNHPNVIKS